MVLLSELLVKSIKFILFTYYLYNFGFIKGIAFYYISTYLYQLILYYTIGIEEVTSLEFMFAPLRNENKFTMTGYFILESFEPEKIKNLIIEKAIKKFKRLRLKLTYTLGNYYWKEFPVEEAFNQVKIYSDINLKINDDILKYVLKEQATPFNLNEFPYEFQLLRHGQGGFLLTKFDHSLSDGIGLLGLLIAMADNYNINLYPKLGEASMFSIFMLQLLSPFYVIEKIYNAIKIKYIDGPFKLGKGKKRSNIKKAAISKYYSFDAISKISKENKLTFNDMIVAIMSKVSKTILQDNDPNTNFDKKTIVIGMSINLRSMPESLEKHKILNNASGHPFHLKLIDDPLKEGKEVQDILTTQIKNPYRNLAGVKLIALLHTLIFSDMVTDLSNDNYDNIDIWASNVPGPKKELYFAGIKATELVVIPTANNFNFFIGIFSYAGKFRISLTLDSALKVCPEKFIGLMEKEIEELINKN